MYYTEYVVGNFNSFWYSDCFTKIFGLRNPPPFLSKELFFICIFMCHPPLLFVNTMGLAVRKGLEGALLKKIIVLQLV